VPPKRILVPTNGSLASQHAADLAFRLATREDEEVLVVTAASAPDVLAGVLPANPLRRRELVARRQIVRAMAERGRAQGARVRASVEIGEPEAVILEAAASCETHPAR
jgi:nucleotide-binding universal stress UspA family protein